MLAISTFARSGRRLMSKAEHGEKILASIPDTSMLEALGKPRGTSTGKPLSQRAAP